MFEPDSLFLIVLLLVASAGLLYVLVRCRPLAARIGAAGGAVLLAVVSGVLMVNHYYGYYRTWSELSADLTGSYAAFSTAHGARGSTSPRHGRLVAVDLPGTLSGIHRRGYVYLPPQYFQRAYATTRFPVVELLHGSPGTPDNWILQMNVAAQLDRLLADHLIGPMIAVMPAINDGNRFEECVDAPGALDDTYISQDVPTDIRGQFRASTVPAEWGIAGYSSGGYCAANLALRHRGSFGAAGLLDAYFRPQDGPAAAALRGDPAAVAANDPLATAQQLAFGANPLPAFWLSAGTDMARDYQGARAFVAALHGVQAVTFTSEPGAGHNFYAWRPAVPRMLAWMWGVIAPPELKIQFPLAGPVSNAVVVAPRAPTRREPGSVSPSPPPSPARSSPSSSATSSTPSTATSPSSERHRRR